MTPNYQPWIFFGFSIFQFLYNVGLTIYMLRKDKEKVTNSRFKEIEDRVTQVEAKVKSMPVCGNHARMEETDRHINAKLDSIGKLLSKIDGRLEGVNRMVDLLTQNELNGGK